MTRILEATCQAGVVKVAGHTVVPTPTILSQGTQSSTGLLIMEGDRATYIATNTTDLVTTLTAIASSLGTIASSLVSIAASDGSPGLIISIGVAAAQLTAAQAALTTLKGNLK